MTLHEVESLPRASAIGNALVELAQPRLVKAWTYLADWQGLERAKVPSPFRRELLDNDALGHPDLETEATAAIADWERHGASVPRLIVGDLGTGKSYAGARWVHSRFRRGQTTLWVSVATWSALDFEFLRAEQRKAIDASSIVLDDLGVGANLWVCSGSG